MVNGLNTFREYFKDYSENYVIIGGTACDIIIDAAGFTPRATKDIDIILVVEALTPAFVKKFWEFIKAANYERTEQSADDRKYYRFLKPENKDFPFQIELFSRQPDLLKLAESAHLTPIPVDDDLSSLSAILMDEEYYAFTLANCEKVHDLHRANTEALICLKARAFLDMKERKEKGEKVEEKHIKKHKADVFRLGALLTAGDTFELPGTIRNDLSLFATSVASELPDKAIFKEMEMPGIDVFKLFETIKTIFQINNHIIRGL